MPEKNLITFKRLDSDANIFVQFDEKPLDLQGFVATAPTGYETPPEPVHVGQYTFYFYGPGRGGVQYADRYFLNLRGKTLYVTFDGPPSHARQQAEPLPRRRLPCGKALRMLPLHFPSGPPVKSGKRFA